MRSQFRHLAITSIKPGVGTVNLAALNQNNVQFIEIKIYSERSESRHVEKLASWIVAHKRFVRRSNNDIDSATGRIWSRGDATATRLNDKIGRLVFFSIHVHDHWLLYVSDLAPSLKMHC